jgi:lactate racemase
MTASYEPGGLAFLCRSRAAGQSGAMTTTTDTGANRAVSSRTEAAVLGGVGDILQPDQVSEFVAAAIAGAGIDNKRVCLVVPDATRTCPLPLLLRAMREGLARASQVTVLIALGTHQGMSEEHLGRHLGYRPDELDQT